MIGFETWGELVSLVFRLVGFQSVQAWLVVDRGNTSRVRGCTKGG